MNKHDIAALKASVRLSELVGRRVKLKRQGMFLRGCCPFHKERTPSFWVNDTTGNFGCFGCATSGDVLDWIMLTKGVSFYAAVAECGGVINPHSIATVATLKFPEDNRHDDTRRIAHAHSLWLKREPIAATLAERYLATARAIPGPYPDILGYCRHAYCSVLGEETEALIAPLQNSAGHVTAVQQIFLCRETDDAWRDEKGKRVKRTLGAMQDGCVRLGVPDTVLGLAGSVEDALAASSLYSLPVWATCGEQRMARVWIPPEIETLMVFADRDGPGGKAALDAFYAHRDQRKVHIMYPDGPKDWAEEVETRAMT